MAKKLIPNPFDQKPWFITPGLLDCTIWRGLGGEFSHNRTLQMKRMPSSIFAGTGRDCWAEQVWYGPFIRKGYSEESPSYLGARQSHQSALWRKGQGFPNDSMKWKQKLDMENYVSCHSARPCFRLNMSLWEPWAASAKFSFLFFFFLLLFRAEYRSSQARGQIGAAVGTCTTITAMWDPSHVCNFHHSSQQHQIINSLSKTRDQTHILMDISWVHYHWATTGTPCQVFLIIRITCIILF